MKLKLSHPYSTEIDANALACIDNLYRAIALVTLLDGSSLRFVIDQIGQTARYCSDVDEKFILEGLRLYCKKYL